MKTTRITLTIQVPTSNGSAFAAGLDDLLHRCDGQTTKSSQFDFSPEFVALRLGTQTNIALVANDIETVDQLRAYTEAKLIALPGIGYPMLKEIVVALAKRSHTLAGCTVAIDDQIELLKLQDVAYRMLKKKGFNAISQLVALDAVDLELVLGRLVNEVIRALVQINRPPAALNPDRPLSAVVEGEYLARLLTEAGVNITAPVRTFTASGLQAALSEHPHLSDSSARGWVGHIREILDRCGYQLPD